MFDLQMPPQSETGQVQEPPIAGLAAPAWDLTVGLINATVQIDQNNGDGTRRVGTAFLIEARVLTGRRGPCLSPRTTSWTAWPAGKRASAGAARARIVAGASRPSRSAFGKRMMRRSGSNIPSETSP